MRIGREKEDLLSREKEKDRYIYIYKTRHLTFARDVKKYGPSPFRTKLRGRCSKKEDKTGGGKKESEGTMYESRNKMQPEIS